MLRFEQSQKGHFGFKKQEIPTGEGICLNQNGLKPWYLAVALAASSWLGTWRNQGDELPSWSGGGLGVPASTSPACPARTRFRARRLRIWRITPRSTAR